MAPVGVEPDSNNTCRGAAKVKVVRGEGGRGGDDGLDLASSGLQSKLFAMSNTPLTLYNKDKKAGGTQK